MPVSQQQRRSVLHGDDRAPSDPSRMLADFVAERRLRRRIHAAIAPGSAVFDHLLAPAPRGGVALVQALPGDKNAPPPETPTLPEASTASYSIALN
ncbi:MAG: hypothetical protein D6798_17440, partial [Deltaproteobacteria bacterium]